MSHKHVAITDSTVTTLQHHNFHLAVTSTIFILTQFFLAPGAELDGDVQITPRFGAVRTEHRPGAG